jgi:hypothetical protein
MPEGAGCQRNELCQEGRREINRENGVVGCERLGYEKLSYKRLRGRGEVEALCEGYLS